MFLYVLKSGSLSSVGVACTVADSRFLTDVDQKLGGALAVKTESSDTQIDGKPLRKLISLSLPIPVWYLYLVYMYRYVH